MIEWITTHMDAAEWGPPIIVIGVGLAIGILLWSRLDGSEDPAVAEQARRIDLDRERRYAVEALKALEAEKSKLAPADYAAEHKALLARGAAVLRALDEPSPEPTTHPLSEQLRALRAASGDAAFRAALADLGISSSPGIGAGWRGALVTLVVMALVGGIAWNAGDDAIQRRPGGSMTGTMGPAAGLEAKLEADPTDIDTMNELTRVAISRSDLPSAMKWNQRALQQDPSDPGARTQTAVLAAMANMTDRALERLESIVADHPEHVEAWMYRGVIELRAGKLDEAVESLETAARLDPRNPAISQALSQARSITAASEGGSASTMAPAPSGPVTTVVAGTVTLPDALAASVSGSETLYVSLRAPTGGPPLAASKLQISDFPRAFTITTADGITMGEAPRPFPETMNLTVRIDGDGNPMTREDVVAAATLEVSNGASDVVVTLAAP